MARQRDLRINEVFGKWTVKEQCKRLKGGNKYVLCECLCGSQGAVLVSNLLRGTSLGCAHCRTRTVEESREAFARRTPFTNGRDYTIELREKYGAPDIEFIDGKNVSLQEGKHGALLFTLRINNDGSHTILIVKKERKSMIPMMLHSFICSGWTIFALGIGVGVALFVYLIDTSS